jgi:hypothetical protein
MAKHLESSGVLVGKTESEVHSMLDSRTDKGTKIGDDMLVYAVKDVGGSDHIFLTIVLDADRRVVRVMGPRPH